jgi:multidrug efflux system membrane fusion protein
MESGQRDRVRSSAVLFVAVMSLIAGGCSEPSTSTTELVRPVKTMVVAAGDDVRIRSFPATVGASRRVERAFQVPGLLVKLPVREGQKVAKGDVIGQLDQARATLTALQAGERPEERLRREAQVRAAEARLANARQDLDRQTNLLPKGGVSRSQFEASETAYRVAQEDLAAARQLLEKGMIGREEDILAKEAEIRGLEGRVVEADIQLQDTTLRAPYDGVIAQRLVEEGQNVTEKQRVVQFQDVDEILVAMDVPETIMAADIQSADIVQMLAELSAASGLQFPVEIREVAQVADPTTQTFKVRAATQTPEGIRALPGMTATVAVTYHRAKILGDRILVPVSAVFKRDSGEQA